MDSLLAELREIAEWFAVGGRHDNAKFMRAVADEIIRLRYDEARINWLDDPSNASGLVQLPRECVRMHPRDLRAAIDAAMASGRRYEWRLDMAKEAR